MLIRIMRHINSFVLLAFSLGIISCSTRTRGENVSVSVQYNSSIEPLAEMVSSIELIPLETDSIHYIGNRKNLIVSDDSYIITDITNGNIFRYSQDGKFLNRIGFHGRGPEDYTHIYSVQLVDSLLYVFSNPKVLVYNLDGDYLSSMVLRNDHLGEMSYLNKDEIITYFGYDSIHNHRLGRINNGILTYYLPSKEKVMHYSPLDPIYSSRRDSLFFIDSYNSTIMLFHDDKVSSYLSFDFGKYSIPDDFYRFSDTFESTNFLLKHEFAMITSFLCDHENHFMGVLVQKSPRPEAYYGFDNRGTWHWFSAGELGNDVFADSFKVLTDGALYCLLDPLLIDSFPTELLEKVKDKTVFYKVNKEDNYILAILYMRL